MTHHTFLLFDSHFIYIARRVCLHILYGFIPGSLRVRLVVLQWVNSHSGSIANAWTICGPSQDDEPLLVAGELRLLLAKHLAIARMVGGTDILQTYTV